ncbi:MAG: 50S ribosomal protein L21 [Elusimicrobia bacterium]|nr:50S ribosomal protein L21 [Elusimicrobiota bacterium]
MYAVIETGSKQLKVEAGMNVLVEKLPAKVGDEVILDKVLMIGDGEKATIGRPVVDGATVIATVVRQTRGPKLIVFKKRSKKGYKKMQGHRQNLTELQIKEIKTN